MNDFNETGSHCVLIFAASRMPDPAWNYREGATRVICNGCGKYREARDAPLGKSIGGRETNSVSAIKGIL